MAIPPLVLRIIADNSGVTKGVAQTQKQVSGLKGFMQKNGAMIYTALAAGVVAGVAASVKAASDLNEQLNRTKEVFEGSSAAVIAFSETTASSMGIAQAETLRAASNFGAMFDSAKIAEDQSADMSQVLVRLAADMASFNDQDPSEMLDRLQGGLAGMARPLRNFGVFISASRVEAELFRMGMHKVNGEFTDAQKVQARYNIILQDTKKQQGDFGRTLGHSLPNQMRKLKAQTEELAASFGEILIPVLVDAAEAVNNIIGPLIDAIGKTEEFIAAHPVAETAVGHFADTLKEQSIPGLGLLQDLFGDNAKAAKDEFGPAVENVSDQVREMAQRLLGTENSFDGLAHQMAKGGIAANRFANMTGAKFREWATKAGENFDAVGEALKAIGDDAKVTASKIIHEFNRQATAIANYRDNLQTVAARNIPDELLQQLIDMGIGGANILAQLANASDQKFNQMVGAMKRAQRQNNALRDDLARLRNEAAREMVVAIRFDVGNIPSFTGSHQVTPHAMGGPVSAWRPYLVGETGPELFMPSVSGTIVPNNQIGGSGGNTFNIYGDIDSQATADRFARKVESAFNRAASRH